MCRFGLIILAAGGSSRLGQPKQMVSHHGKTLLRHAADVALASRYDPVVVVLGAQTDLMRLELHGLRVLVRENPRWERGMASSLHVGLDALPTEIEGIGIMVCDQPFLTAHVLDSLAEALIRTNAPLAACEYAGTLGVPALFRAALLPELLALAGAEGGKKIIFRHAAEAARVPFPSGSMDIDTLEDMARLTEEAASP